MPMDDALFRNHLNNTTGDGHRFGEIAAATYHLAVLKPDEFGATYIAWADSIRTVLGGYHAEGNLHVISERWDSCGTVTPAANPYD